MALRTLQVAHPRNPRGSLGVFVETWEVRKSGPSLGCAVFLYDVLRDMNVGTNLLKL